MFENGDILLPYLSPKDQERLNKQWKRRWQKAAKWAGFSGKTLWDWLPLLATLAIPVAIAIGTTWFSAQQSQTSEQACEEQHQTDIQIANDQQQENALQAYLDRMSDLLLNDKLGESQLGDEVRNVARSRTLNVLPQLNSTRKGKLVQFLKEASLIDKKNVIISLNNADLSDADLSDADLRGTDLRGANLSGANLSWIDLSGADLSYTYYVSSDHAATPYMIPTGLSYANLSHANLGNANLSSADLNNANLNNANLSHANLGRAPGVIDLDVDLSHANLSHADLSYANLSSAYLTDADLSNTNLSNANLSSANLYNAKVTSKQLEGAVMPDGSKHP